MKTKEELELIQKEYKELTNKLSDLSENELKQVVGGLGVLSTDEEIHVRSESAKIRTGDTRKNLTAEQLTPEYIKRQIFGSKFDE